MQLLFGLFSFLGIMGGVYIIVTDTHFKNISLDTAATLAFLYAAVMALGCIYAILEKILEKITEKKS